MKEIREEFFILYRDYLSPFSLENYSIKSDELFGIINNEIGLKKLNRKILKNIYITNNEKYVVEYHKGESQNFDNLYSVILHLNYKYNLKLFKTHVDIILERFEKIRRNNNEK